MAILTDLIYKGIPIKDGYLKIVSLSCKSGKLCLDIEIHSYVNDKKSELVGRQHITLDLDSSDIMGSIYGALKSEQYPAATDV